MTHRPRPAATPVLLRWLWLLIVVVACGVACCAPLPSDGQAPASPAAAVPPAPPATAKREPANVMGYQKADWLEREGRASGP